MNEEIIKRISLVKEIEIKNEGIIKKARIRFSPCLNVIVGENASGKTTVINVLLSRYSNPELSCGDLIELNINNELEKSTLLIDDILGSVDYERRIRVLKKLEKCNGNSRRGWNKWYEK